ncbi:phosphorothioated DNA-binding restriction endonuclease [Nocardiopsis eucommiae]|uniref:phosphorothioated DNA-binding restriction endonuclease n=1 Tax=Nocardiopsis eucommiae TaxID=2831970 RepID=UPI003D7320F6
MDWLERVGSIRRWSRDGYRAPHKPLLLLYALGRHQRGSGPELVYSEVEAELDRLLREFGPNRRTTSAYPFHHLVSDGLWRVTTPGGGGSPGASPPKLRDGARGALVPELSAELDRDPALRGRMARLLLDGNFEPSLHADILALVGLSLGPGPGATVQDRDPGFRALVLSAYEYRCAFCGYEGLIDGTPVGLEAAHVRWWAFDGPDDLANGLCLCSMHHLLFDKGVLGASPDRTVTVSSRFAARSPAAERAVFSLEGAPVLRPRRGCPTVADDHLEWHTRQVFRGPAREVGGGDRATGTPGSERSLEELW